MACVFLNDAAKLQVVDRSRVVEDDNVNKVVVGHDHDDHIHSANNNEDTTMIPTQKQRITSMGIATSIALGSVTIATHLEQQVSSTLGIPGTMCAFLALFGITFERLIHYTINAHQEWKPGGNVKPLSSFSNVIKSLQYISKVSPILSNACVHLLFAAVGTTANLSSAIVGGPKALGFASLALVVHSITVLVGTYVGNHFLLLRRRRKRLSSSTTVVLNNHKKKKMLRQQQYQWPMSSWEEVLTASNAAIGGPSTAAAFAVGLIPNNNNNNDDDGKVSSVEVKDNDRRSQLRSALVIGATFWGVFGYAIATGEWVSTDSLYLFANFNYYVSCVSCSLKLLLIICIYA